MVAKDKDFRIVFMGTPTFALPSLKKLLERNFNVVGVITAPDKPAGRGQKLRASPVKKFAQKKGLPILQPDNLKGADFQKKLYKWQPTLQVVVAFRMLPPAVFNLPDKGSINLHASLLPAYRGAAPINWAIINGEKQTGVTTFFIEKKIDTGEILFQQSTTIGSHETAGELHDRLKIMGGNLVVKTAKSIQTGDYTTYPQHQSSSPKRAPKIHKSDCQIDWSQPVDQVYNFIRGLSPYPTAWTTLGGKHFKIFKVDKNHHSHNKRPGQAETDYNSYIKVFAQNGYILLKEVQIAGKQKMKVSEFLKGWKQEISYFQ